MSVFFFVTRCVGYSPVLVKGVRVVLSAVDLQCCVLLSSL